MGGPSLPLANAPLRLGSPPLPHISWDCPQLSSGLPHPNALEAAQTLVTHGAARLEGPESRNVVSQVIQLQLVEVKCGSKGPARQTPKLANSISPLPAIFQGPGGGREVLHHPGEHLAARAYKNPDF